MEERYVISYPTIGLLKDSDCIKNYLEDINEDILNNELGKEAFSKEDYDKGKCFYGFSSDKKVKTGIDVPVLINKEPQDNKGTIIFVGESVLRDAKADYSSDEANVLIGTPFAIVGNYRQPDSCDVYKKIFQHWLNKEYKIYITDYIKLWNENVNYLKGNSYKDFRNNAQNLLINEINTVINKEKPNYIVTFGNKAKEVIGKIFNSLKSNPKIINIIHPSINARVHWRVEMYEELITALTGNNLNDIDVKELEGYKVFKNTILDDNVANFANKLISREIK